MSSFHTHTHTQVYVRDVHISNRFKMSTFRLFHTHKQARFLRRRVRLSILPKYTLLFTTRFANVTRCVRFVTVANRFDLYRMFTQ